MVDIADKVILITGANSGIGYAAADYCLRAGAKVALHARSDKKASTAVEALADSAAKPVFGDLNDFNAPSDIVKQAIEAFGRIDGLVNNAGIFPRNDIHNATQDDFDAIMNVNLRSPLFLIQAAVRHWQAEKIKGVIVNIGSINAHCGQSDLLVYSMSKGALQTMTRNMCDTLSPLGIRINQLNVGWTHTEKEEQIQQQSGRGKDWHKNIPQAAAPFGRILSPQDIAEHIGFWLSDASHPISGQCYECEQYPLIGRNKLNQVKTTPE